MTTLAIALGAMVFYLVAYHTYGRWLGHKIFRLSTSAEVPSVAMEDGKDYVPTSKGVVFGHHFTSIAGTGPIVGPALAVMWGWLPALLWVLFGSVFIGAVHDLGALVVSMRNRGHTVGDIAGRVISPRVRVLFLLILFLALTIVLAIFGLVIASVFETYPQSIAPCLLQIPLAVAIGLLIHRKGGNIMWASLLALALMYLSVVYGNVGWLGEMNTWLKAQGVMWWVSVLLVYSYVASVLPVWVLLQPRDYINALQLLATLALVVMGLVVAGVFGGAVVDGIRPELKMVAPAVESSLELKQVPAIFPFLFITIACGAISGFHCLVSSGTSSKQLRCETDARFVGYGSMLTEGFLAVLVILACVAGLGLGISGAGGETLLGTEAWDARYQGWGSMNLAAKVGAFVDGSANFLKALGLSAEFSTALMGVFVASFAATTLDTACRLQRYVVQELATCLMPADGVRRPGVGFRRPLSCLANKHGATIFAIAVAWWMASLPGAPGKPAGTGGLILWPLFGATNQLLGGLAFLVILFWMKRQRMPLWFLIVPAFLMLVLPAWAMAHQIFVQAVGGTESWIGQQRWLLVGIGLLSLVLELWMILEAVWAWKKLKAGGLDESQERAE
ncbi:carbon starvation protein A [Verrucomicrobiaceae bacterium N1E253]|uniref:Carbon starvation protein A n=1 Tax=Oceaniferula marina TaxID=2748318 RepID=A0A851G9F7_9BACT|nr:carbon starvation protein A [Oceaniferula marina]NWK54056.1 carbon starvation protein A [Oceaniferula marina]